MKKGWEKVYLTDISVNLDSKRIPITKGVRTGGVYPYYGASGIVDYVSDYIFDDDLLLISEDGANLLARSTPIAFSVSGKIWVNNHAHILKFENKITQRYIERYFESIKIDGFVTGAAQPKLNQKALNSIPIIIPKDILEQERIVGILDSAFAKIEAMRANAQQNLQNAKDLFQASLKQELTPKQGWRQIVLPEISTNLDSKRVPITKGVRSNGVYPYYGASGIVDYVESYIFDEDLLLISEDGANLLARSTPIAFSVSGKIWVNNHAHVIQFANIDTQKYIEYYFSSIKIDEFVTGAAQPKLNQKALNSIPINIPINVNEQQSIVEKLDALSERCRAMEENYRQILTTCNDLKQALLKKAFNGEL